MRQECDLKVENILFENNGLQVSLNATPSQLSNVCNSLPVGHEGIEQLRERWAAIICSLSHCSRLVFLVL